jgi:3-hydroxyisobutyrate dehydrogenase-like beta-hydroxyacid dehydrogenase
MLDTPVSGSVPQVKTGTLTIMVGGDEAAYRRVEPVLRVLGTPEYVGGNGHGLVLKLAINISLAVQMLASPKACCSPNATASIPTAPQKS